MLSRRIQFLIVPLLLLLLAGCSQGPERAPALGEAFVGPVVLPLRKDLAPKSQVVGTAKHGERVEVIQTRRRFIRVRTAQGVEGWTDNRQLLSAGQMAAIRDMAERAARLPSCGRATAVAQLYVHAEPSRTSPNIYELSEKAQVEVVGRRIVPRAALPVAAPLVIARPKPPARPRKEQRDAGRQRVPPPPMPAPPKPPANWLELSQAEEGEAEAPPAEEPVKPAKPAPMDEWNLVVTKDGKAGWVLRGKLSMAIPDEVAQYSEGARITSYYSLGKVNDNGVVRDHWLWTTLSQNNVPFDFDAYRVFIWSTRHHRYETAFVERRIEGLLPAQVHPVEVANGKARVKVQGFSVLLRADNGKLVRQTYWFEPYKVRLVDSAEAEAPKDPLEPQLAAAPLAVPPADQNAAAAEQSWWGSLKSRVKGLFSR